MRYLWLALFFSTASYGHEGATGIIKQRMDAFDESKTTLRTIRSALKAGDLDLASTLSQGLIDWAVELPDFFPRGSNTEPSEAKDTIWQDWAGFIEATRAFEDASRTLSSDPSPAHLKQLASTCKGCHDQYRD